MTTETGEGADAAEDTEEGVLTVDELAARAGVTVRTVRFYSTKGLLPPPVIGPRRVGRYGRGHLARLALIEELQRQGMTLAAIEREWQLLSGEAHLAIRSDRRDHLPYGLYGGQPGTASTNLLYGNSNGSRDRAQLLPTMISTTMRAGERMYHRQAGGGGWGDPLQRDPARA